jgi:molybdopterin-containing oxidoreductase family iron-sulfur binding subunit
MKITRKEFLGFCGAGLVALSGRKVLALLGSPGQSPAGPASGAAARKQWGMIIDTTKCAKEQGCVRCIEACDSAHNIPSFQNSAHRIEWIWEVPFEDIFPSYQTQYLENARKQEPTPVLCNHCDDPPCVRVCPTGATWKREEDGIVMMDWHRCIGCRYCMAACPYGSRSFNWVDPRPHIKTLNADFPTRTKGVVEKCTFCSERLAKGQMPACVEACPEKALVFGDLNDPRSPIRNLLASQYTLRRKPELGTGPNIYYVV